MIDHLKSNLASQADFLPTHSAVQVHSSELEILITGMITFSHSIRIGTSLLRGLDVSSSSSNVKFTRIGRRFHSPPAKGVALYGEQWRIMTNTLTNTMTNTYVVIFCRLQFLVDVIIPDIRISSSPVNNLACKVAQRTRCC